MNCKPEKKVRGLGSTGAVPPHQLGQGQTGTHAGRHFSRFSRSSKVTRFAKLREEGEPGLSSGVAENPASPPPAMPGTNSLANIIGQALQGDVVQGQVAQVAQLGEAFGEPGGRSRGTPEGSAAVHGAGQMEPLRATGLWGSQDPRGE